MIFAVVLPGVSLFSADRRQSAEFEGNIIALRNTLFNLVEFDPEESVNSKGDEL